MPKTKEQINDEILGLLKNNEGQEFSINEIKEKVSEKNKTLKWRLKRLVKQGKIKRRNTEYGKVFYLEAKKISLKRDKLRIDKKQLKIGLIAIFIIFIITFSIGEIVVRILDPQMLYNEHNPSYPTYPKEVEYNEDLGWSTVKNYEVHPYSPQARTPIVNITHNSKGYRMGHEVDENKTIVVMTGDSLTYGFWVDDKEIVSAQLNELLGNNWEVINLGVGGYGTGQSFLRFVRDGLQYKPKVVVHALFTNDFSNIVSVHEYNVYKPLFKIGEDMKLKLTNVPVPVSPNMELSYPKEREHAYKGFKRFMRSGSHLYVLYKAKIDQIKSRLMQFFRPSEKLDYFNTYRDGEMWAIEKEYSDTMKYSYALNSLIIREYNKLAEDNNITFVFVLIGDRISVDPEIQKATEERYYNADRDFFDYEKPYRLLEEFAKSENIKIINLHPLFKKEFENKRSMYLEGDHHLNDYGHELFAKEVYNLMVKEGIV
tara:strand:+ start:1256 stop:2707 length:1452 start_codon:yes stop_codon:yes gene_type:complete